MVRFSCIAIAIAAGCSLIALVPPATAQIEQRQTQAKPPLILEFQKLEDSWSVALVGKDQYALENLLAPTFIDVSAKAAITTRNQSIADTLSGLPQRLLSVEQKVVTVRVISDVAVVEGTYMLQLKEAQRTRDERGVFTHVYQRTHNSWSCVSAQRTALVDQLEGSRAAASGESSGVAAGASEKKSNAALPFHIPLLHKGLESKAPEQTQPTTANPPQ